MKKYSKPTMKMEELKMNQAIAACTRVDPDYAIEHKGYINQSTYGLQNIQPTIEDAQKINVYCPVYDVFYTYSMTYANKYHGYVYDSNPNAVYEHDLYVNSSDVQGMWSYIDKIFIS